MVSNEKRARRVAAWAVTAVSCACFFATTLLVRQDAAGGLVAHYTSRAVEIVSCLIVAFAACRKGIHERALLVTGSVAAILGLAFEFLSRLDSFDTILTGVAAGAFNGWSLAACTLLFARLFCSFSLRGATVLVPLSYAGSHVLFLISCAVEPGHVLYMKAALVVVALAGLAVLGPARLSSMWDDAMVCENGLSFAGLFAQGRWRSLLFGALVFPLLYGFMAQICDAAQVSNGLFDMSTELVGIAFLLVLALLGLPRKKVLEPETVFVVLLPVFATAMLLLPLFWGNEVFIAGFVMKCGFLVYTSLMWVCVCGAVGGRPAPSYFYFGVAIGVYHLAIMIGRLLAGVLGANAGLSDATVALVSLFAIWLLSLASLAMLLMRRFGDKRGGLPAFGRGSFGPSSPDAFDAFAARYALSGREAAVCREFARGRTVDYIAKQLVVSPETVKTHLKRAYGKTGCHNRQDLIDKIEESAVREGAVREAMGGKGAAAENA